MATTLSLSLSLLGVVVPSGDLATRPPDVVPSSHPGALETMLTRIGGCSNGKKKKSEYVIRVDSGKPRGISPSVFLPSPRFCVRLRPCSAKDLHVHGSCAEITRNRSAPSRLRERYLAINGTANYSAAQRPQNVFVGTRWDRKVKTWSQEGAPH